MSEPTDVVLSLRTEPSDHRLPGPEPEATIGEEAFPKGLKSFLELRELMSVASCSVNMCARQLCEMHIVILQGKVRAGNQTFDPNFRHRCGA